MPAYIIARMRLLPILRARDVRRAEEAARGQPLMERAGTAAADVARNMPGARDGSVLVLAGPGNNGGDAFVVARCLREAFFDVAVVFRGDQAKLPPDAGDAYRAFVAAGGTTVADFPDRWHGALIVDGLFGIGLARALSADYATLVRRANESGVPILALDVPSGLDADTGVSRGETIRAAATATFIALKPGLLTGEGLDFCGAVSVHSLGLELEGAAPASGHRLEWSALAAELPAVLERQRAERPQGNLRHACRRRAAPTAWSAHRCSPDGPRSTPAPARYGSDSPRRARLPSTGASPSSCCERRTMSWRQEQVRSSAGRASASRPRRSRSWRGRSTHASPSSSMPTRSTRSRPTPQLAAAVAKRSAPTLATPHPAEAGRLLGSTSAAVQSDRLSAALDLANRLRAHVVIKGAGSVLAHPDGTWDINASGNAGLASAGTGDVLAGVAGAFLAQGIDAKDALRLAVCVHGAAADRCVAGGRGPLGLTAGELAPAVRALLNEA